MLGSSRDGTGGFFNFTQEEDGLTLLMDERCPTSSSPPTST